MLDHRLVPLESLWFEVDESGSLSVRSLRADFLDELLGLGLVTSSNRSYSMGNVLDTSLSRVAYQILDKVGGDTC